MQTALLLIALLCSLCLAPLAAQETWTVESHLRNSSSFSMVEYADSLHCIVVGSTTYNYPRAMKSDDGGKTWEWIQNMPLQIGKKEPTPYSAAYPDKDLILLSCSGSIIRRSTDAGKTWQDILLEGLPTKESIGWITMLNKNSGFLWFAPKLLYKTSDGGATWIKDSITSMGEDKLIRKIRLFSLTQFCIFATNPVADTTWIYKTYDAGKTWDVFPGPVGSPFVHAAFPDTTHFWVAGNIRTGVGDLARDIIMHSNDGGKSWQKQLDTLISSPDAPTAWGIFGIDFYDNNNGLVVGHRGKILRTKDGGKTWVTQRSGLQLDDTKEEFDLGLLNDVKFLTKNTAVIAGFDYAVLRYGQPSTSFVNTEGNTVLQPTQLTFFPHPASSSMTVSISSPVPLQPGDITVYDMTGRQVLPSIPCLSDQTTIDVTILPLGMYTISYRTPKAIVTHPFLITR